jgi:hypothetical protein
MNGYFDANNDILADISSHVGQPLAWYKTTIGSFRLTELVAHYQDAGWEVTPLLVVRDPRYVWSSLIKKKYGKNGTTAEDPPLRMRLRRFKEDWLHCLAVGWPVIRFESLLSNPGKILRETCEKLGLPWDDAMLTWPKNRNEIVDARHGSRTFKINRAQGLKGICHTKSHEELSNILPGDLAWLEKEFNEFNVMNDYPLSLAPLARPKMLDKSAVLQAVPTFDVTRRKEWNLRRKPFRWLTVALLARIKKALA